MATAVVLIALCMTAAMAGQDDRHSRRGRETTTVPARPPEVAASEVQRALEHAVSVYQSGEPGVAREELQRLLALGPALPGVVRREAYAWLGDIQFGEHGEAAARNSFEALLAEDPTYFMDPFQHPPEVCEAFERARNALPRPVNPPIGPVTPGPRPWPVLTLAPLGAYYFKEGKVGPGLGVGMVQATGVALSVATGVQMGNINGGSEEEKARFARLRRINAAAGAAAWVAWGAPVVIETVRWSANRPVMLELGPGYVGLGGRF
jgi:hypothetical protein